MQKNTDITFQNNIFFVCGDLNLSNVMSVYQKSLQHMHTAPELIFDFSQVPSSNSAGLALVIEWIKYANKNHKKIGFQHLSPALLSIAKAAGMDKMIIALPA